MRGRRFKRRRAVCDARNGRAVRFGGGVARVRLARAIGRDGRKRLHARWRGLFSDRLKEMKPPSVWGLHPNHTALRPRNDFAPARRNSSRAGAIMCDRVGLGSASRAYLERILIECKNEAFTTEAQRDTEGAQRELNSLLCAPYVLSVSAMVNLIHLHSTEICSNYGRIDCDGRRFFVRFFVLESLLSLRR
jgi:hypothetical protein